jgi:putative DNA primase/helicase
MNEHPFTDAGNAMRFAEAHKGRLLYCYSAKAWLAWMGTHWTEDPAIPIKLAKETARALYEAAASAPTVEQRTALAKWAIASESERRLSAMVHLAECELEVKAEALDTDPWLLNVQNGTIDLRTGRLLPHAREPFITKVLPIAYHPDAACPRWMAFLTRIFGGQLELVGFVQRAFGYSLTGDTREDCFFLLWGAGRNGKSTLVETILGLLGPYAQPLDVDTLLTKKPDMVALNDLYTVKGARFVATVEPDMGRHLAESRVKRLTGRDTIKAKKLYADLLAYRPSFKLFLATNHKPIIRGTDHAIWSRIRLLPFTVTIAEAEQDKTLPDALRAEWPGVLRWAVEGCLAWQREGLGLPEQVRKATHTYRAEMDELGKFLQDKCVVENGATVPAGELYQAYEGWCHQSGEKALTKTALGLRLTERGFAPDRTNSTRFWVGLRFRTTVDPDPSGDRPGGVTPDDTNSQQVPPEEMHRGFPGKSSHVTSPPTTDSSGQPVPDWVSESE